MSPVLRLSYLSKRIRIMSKPRGIYVCNRNEMIDIFSYGNVQICMLYLGISPAHLHLDSTKLTEYGTMSVLY